MSHPMNKEDLTRQLEVLKCEAQTHAQKYQAVAESYLNVLRAKTSEEDFARLKELIRTKADSYKPKSLGLAKITKLQVMKEGT